MAGIVWEPAALNLILDLCRVYWDRRERMPAADLALKLSDRFDQPRSADGVVGVVRKLRLDGLLPHRPARYVDRNSRGVVDSSVWQDAVAAADERDKKQRQEEMQEGDKLELISGETTELAVVQAPPPVVSPDRAGIERLIRELRQGPATVGEVSRRWDKSEETVLRAIALARAQGYDVGRDPASKLLVLRKQGEEMPPLDLVGLEYRKVRFAAFSDTQLGSKYQQLRLLRQAYGVATAEGVHFAVHAGDLNDGMKVYKGHEQELFLFGADEQRRYAETNYPQADFKTYAIEGNHDESFRKVAGHVPLRLLCEHRPDLVYRGAYTARFVVKGVTIQMIHGKGGGSYARSYKPQKLAEALIGQAVTDIRATKAMDAMPHVILIGHYHYFIHFEYMGAEVFVLPCFQAQTPFLARSGLVPTIGFCIIDLDLDADDYAIRVLCRRYNWSKHVVANDYMVDPGQLEEVDDGRDAGTAEEAPRSGADPVEPDRDHD